MQALKSCIIISADFDAEIERLKEQLAGHRIVVFCEENFKIEHAKALVAEAYISETDTKYIVACAKEFTSVAQNSLLKLFEEPPRNIEFIVISPTKSNLLPTVRSRLPLLKKETKKNSIEVKINLKRIDYQEVFEFLKEHQRISRNDAKDLLEAIFFKATVVDAIELTSKQLNSFDKAYRLLDLNSRPLNVLTMVLMNFARER